MSGGEGGGRKKGGGGCSLLVLRYTAAWFPIRLVRDGNIISFAQQSKRVVLSKHWIKEFKKIAHHTGPDHFPSDSDKHRLNKMLSGEFNMCEGLRNKRGKTVAISSASHCGMALSF